MTKISRLPISMMAVLTLLTTYLLVLPPASALSQSLDKLMVSVVGGVQATGNATVPASLQELTTDGSLGETIQLPTTRADEHFAFTLGADRDQQGNLSQSADGQSVVIGGYDHEPGPVSLNGSFSENITRVIASVDEE